ncbi:AsmA protein [Desulfobaculum xiamenense]|uniref:AsmA protein n=1 Tax=Desulfobaculum xiamenense TaxID=995050 RepID=A0A846QMP9_9BACT|nr:AsmA family protein [Desulfobaculum xiamenense]NJB69408.1 AsmA protein [Desulfobaculum xiamenense]
MKKLFVILGLAASVIVTIAALAAVLLPHYLDPNDYKDEIAQLVKKETGRDITFKGDIALSLFPWLGVELGPVALSNAPGFGAEPFVEAERTAIKVKLLPLLNRDVRVKYVDVDGLSLRLARNGKGVSNWADLAGGSAAGSTDTGQTTPNATAQQTSSGGLPVETLAVGGISIRNAQLAWDDQMTDQHYRLSGMHLATGPLAPGRPFDFTFETSAASKAPALSGNVRLAANAEVSPDFMRHTLKNASLDVAVTGDDIPGGQIEAALAANIMIDLNAGNISLESLNFRTAELDVSGSVEVKHFDAEPEIATNLAVREFNPRALMRLLDIEEPQTADPTVLQKAAMTFTATATSDSVDVSKLDLVVDDTAITGFARVKDFAKPQIAFDLAANALDVNRYLPPASDKDAEAEPDTTPPATPEKKDDSLRDMLKTMKVDGRVKVESLNVHKLHLQNMEVRIKALDGLWRINPFTANVFDGQITSDLTADLTAKATRSTLKTGIRNVSLGSALRNFTGEDYVTGTTNLDLDLAAIGEDWPSVSRTLNGNASVSLRDGVFKGFQIIPEPVRAAAISNDPHHRAEKIEKQQPFDALTASLSVRNGVISTGDTRLSAPHLSGEGAGTLDLSNNWLDYRTTVSITALPRIPFTVKGPVTDPEFSLDKTAFLKETAIGIVNTPLDVGKKAIGIGEDVGKKALDIGEDVGKGTIDIGKDVIQGIGKGIQGIFGGKKKTDE